MRWSARQIGRPDGGAGANAAPPRPNVRPARCPVMPSTVIRRFDYDPRRQTLDVQFVSGRRYRYIDVPQDVAAAFAGAFAKGRFFNARIRDHFHCHELSDETAGDLWNL